MQREKLNECSYYNVHLSFSKVTNYSDHIRKKKEDLLLKRRISIKKVNIIIYNWICDK